jgi:hypothetical protein
VTLAGQRVGGRKRFSQLLWRQAMEGSDLFLSTTTIRGGIHPDAAPGPHNTQ